MTTMQFSQPNTSSATFSDVTSARAFVTVDDVKEPLLQYVVATWNALRHDRAFPCWDDIDPRQFWKALDNLLVLRVIGDCDDYEFRIAGDAHVRVLGITGTPRRLSQLNDYIPGYAATLKPLYDRAVRSRAAYALRTEIRRSSDRVPNFFSESAFLPLGPNDEAVDHVLIASVYHTNGVTLAKPSI
jgi:hypothetical protein